MAGILQFIKNKIVLIFGILLVIAVLVFVGKNTIFKFRGAVSYQTAKVTRGGIVDTVSASGTVATTNRMPVSTQGSGQVKAILVKDGDQVAAGATLMELTLDQTGQQRANQAWTSYLSAKNSLASAQATMYSLQSTMFSKWKIYTDLATNSTYQNSDSSPNSSNRVLTQFTTVQDDWLAAEANYANQQNVVAQAQSSVANAWAAYQLVSPTVVAPMAGTVADVTYTTGMIVSNAQSASSTTISSSQLMSIVTISNPVITVNVSEVDVDKVKSGQKVTVTSDAKTGQTFAATVVGVNRAGVISSGVTNYPTTIQFDSPSDVILPNMSVTADIIVATKDNVLLVPSAAVQAVGGQSVVRVLVNGQAQQAPVETGLTSDTDTEIVTGLTEGQTVITGSSSTGSTSSSGSSPFSSGFRLGGGGGGGAGALRPGGFGGGR